MVGRTWWQKPRIRRDEERDRRVSWLELFYDLVFVVVIAELSHYLFEHLSWEGLGGFIFLFLPVWWVWVGAAIYNDRFETAGLEARVFTFLHLLTVSGLAIFTHDGLGKTSVGYALSYAAARGITTFLWLQAGYHEPIFRPTAVRYGIGFGTASGLFVLSAFISPPQRFVLWTMGLVIDFITPVFTFKHQAALPRFTSSRLPERFGLFVIIVLGESVVAVVNGLAQLPEFSLLNAATGILGLTVAFGVWWMYFDFVARRPHRPFVGWVYAWNYLHLPLVMAIAATGAGILKVITASQEEGIPDSTRVLLAGAMAVSLTAIALLEATLRRTKNEPSLLVSIGLKLGAGTVAIGLGLWSRELGAIALLGSLVLLIAIQMSYSFYTWSKSLGKDGEIEH